MNAKFKIEKRYFCQNCAASALWKVTFPYAVCLRRSLLSALLRAWWRNRQQRRHRRIDFKNPYNHGAA